MNRSPMNRSVVSKLNRFRGLWVAAAAFIVAFQVASVAAQEAILDYDPLDNPRQVESLREFRVAPGAGLKPRKIGVMCMPFREGSLRGVLLTDVFRGSIAERLGLEPEDVIVAVNTHPVSTPNELSLALATATGPVRLRVRNSRDGQIIWLKTTFRFPGGAVAAARAEESYEEHDLQDVEPGADEEG